MAVNSYGSASNSNTAADLVKKQLEEKRLAQQAAAKKAKPVDSISIVNERSRNVLNDTDIKKLIQSSGIIDRVEAADSYNKFARFGFIDPVNSPSSTKEFVFITKPDLNLLNTNNNTLNQYMQRNDYMKDVYERFKPLFLALQYSCSSASGPFINLLTNTISSNVDLPGLSSNTYDTAANIYGTKMEYRGSSLSSDEDFDFTLEFRDSKYFEVYNLFKIYDEYERMKNLGQVPPRTFLYVYRKLLHDMMALYKFIVADDGYTILHFSRIVGVTFTNIPRDVFSDVSDGEVKISVGCRGKFVRDMHRRILSDFNKIVADSMFAGDTNAMAKSYQVPLFDKSIGAPSGVWPNVPYVSVNNNAVTKKELMMKYRLCWGMK